MQVMVFSDSSYIDDIDEEVTPLARKKISILKEPSSNYQKLSLKGKRLSSGLGTSNSPLGFHKTVNSEGAMMVTASKNKPILMHGNHTYNN